MVLYGDFADFHVVLAAGRAIHDGRSPYDVDLLRQAPFGSYYKWPPLLAILAAPIANAPRDVLVPLWTAVGGIAYLVTFLLLIRMERIDWGSRGFYAVSLIFLVFRPSYDTLTTVKSSSCYCCS